MSKHLDCTQNPSVRPRVMSETPGSKSHELSVARDNLDGPIRQQQKRSPPQEEANLQHTSCRPQQCSFPASELLQCLLQSSLGFRRPRKLWSRSRIALYASLISRENLFLSVSSTATRQSPAHRSISHEYMTPSLYDLALLMLSTWTLASEVARHRRSG